MSTLRTGSRLAHNGLNYVLANDTGLVTYRTTAATGLTMKVFTTSATSDATGGVTIGLPVGYFTTVHYVDAVCVRDSASPTVATFAMLRSFTTTSVSVQCFESKTTGVLLGGSIEGLELATAALMVQLMVIGV
jgi:hypothetical protein